MGDIVNFDIIKKYSLEPDVKKTSLENKIFFQCISNLSNICELYYLMIAGHSKMQRVITSVDTIYNSCKIYFLLYRYPCRKIGSSNIIM